MPRLDLTAPNRATPSDSHFRHNTVRENLHHTLTRCFRRPPNPNLCIFHPDQAVSNIDVNIDIKNETDEKDEMDEGQDTRQEEAEAEENKEGVSFSSEPNADQTKPNVFFIMVDDMGYNDIGYQSIDLAGVTPNLDKLAAGGIKVVQQGDEACSILFWIFFSMQEPICFAVDCLVACTFHYCAVNSVL